MSLGNEGARPGSRKRDGCGRIFHEQNGRDESHGGGISSGAVTAHTGLPSSEGSIVVVEDTHFGIHGAVDIEKIFFAMSNGVSSAATAQTSRIFGVMKFAASVLGSEQSCQQKRIIRVNVSGSHG